MSIDDEHYLHRAIRLAMAGRGGVEPNPMVGCVLVKNGRVIGEGHHTHFGGPHAEPTALANCTESPAGATAYVTLEPCCHTDKKTPPCAPRLIAAQITRVVIGCLDPNPQVNGNGVRILREAGIAVDGPLLESECRQLIAPFLALVNLHRPYVTLKWAQSADGKIAGAGGARRQISNALSTQVVHQLRGRCDAIAVGIGTVLSDDPELTARTINPQRIPERFIFDSHLRIPLQSKVLQTASEIPTTVCCTQSAAQQNPQKRAALAALKVSVNKSSADATGRLQLAPLLRSLSQSTGQRVAHLLVEAGPTLASAFFAQDFADRLWVFQASERIDDITAPAAALIPDHFVKTGEVALGSDLLSEYLNTHSPVFACNAASADLELARGRC
jgi:diaminohydroxyphosphoribosylaminopyrimidine deaminase/5-amino-6-(5-phosphoribosylamino)uracil reductase